ncbi:hypothetical protein QBC46DRAFT_419280, partial [Diplogelasinospora grovesii]
YKRQDPASINVFPFIRGNECIGTIEGYSKFSAAPLQYPLGHRVAAICIGADNGMPGVYAEFTCASIENLRPIPPTLTLSSKASVAKLAALPEILRATNGALTKGLNVRPGEHLLVRGALSSIGLCALYLAKKLHPGRIVATAK